MILVRMDGRTKSLKSSLITPKKRSAHGREASSEVASEASLVVASEEGLGLFSSDGAGAGGAGAGCIESYGR